MCAAAAERHERFLEQMTKDYVQAQSIVEELDHLPPPSWLKPESVKLTMSAKRKQEVQHLYGTLTPEGIQSRALQSLSFACEDLALEELLRPSPRPVHEQFITARSTTRPQPRSRQNTNASTSGHATTIPAAMESDQSLDTEDVDMEPADM